jgi:hypothetical protein
MNSELTNIIIHSMDEVNDLLDHYKEHIPTSDEQRKEAR